MTDLRINHTDKASPLWRALVDHYIARLATLRELNDTSKSHDETMKLRGQIAEIKAFLSLADEPPQRRV